MEIEVERKHTDSNTYRKIRPHGNSMSHTSTTIVHMMQMVTGIHHCIYIVLFINMESILEGVVYSLSLSLVGRHYSIRTDSGTPIPKAELCPFVSSPAKCPRSKKLLASEHSKLSRSSVCMLNSTCGSLKSSNSFALYNA